MTKPANLAILCVLTTIQSAIAADPPRPSVDLSRGPLKVSENKRFLVHADGSPFFYLGDTAWELFHRLNREEATKYLTKRAEQRFTVIQAVVLAELDGLRDPNPYGQTPLKDDDPTRPNEGYFQHVDYIVKEAQRLGLLIGMLPTWGDKVGPKGKAGSGPEIFNAKNAALYGEFLGKRYKGKPIIWILGGDRNPDAPERIAIWRAMGQGLRRGDDGEHLITFHPGGGASSATWFHDEPWLDFNMQQNGHCTDTAVWDRINREYRRVPIKPVMDGEPLYEDHPICFKPKEMGYSNAADIRKFAYWDLFAGAHGHTYGNHSIWQMFGASRKPVNGPLNFWFDALDKPGARQMQHVRALMESRPLLTRIPDQDVISSDASSGGKRIQATRAQDGSYAFVYIPASRKLSVRLEKLRGDKLKAWWFDPRTGRAEAVGEFDRKGDREFTPPGEGENQDWVLVLDDVAAGFAPPGQVR